MNQSFPHLQCVPRISLSHAFWAQLRATCAVHSPSTHQYQSPLHSLKAGHFLEKVQLRRRPGKERFSIKMERIGVISDTIRGENCCYLLPLAFAGAGQFRSWVGSAAFANAGELEADSGSHLFFSFLSHKRETTL